MTKISKSKKAAKNSGESKASPLLQFRASEPLREFFQTSPKRVKSVRNMRQYLLYLAMKDGYQPCAGDF